jgi:hypothetical protein
MPETTNDAELIKSKEHVVAQMLKESVEVWRNNPLEAAVLTQLAAMVHSYYRKFHNKKVTEKVVYQDSQDGDWLLRDFVLCYRWSLQLCNRNFWNVECLDNIANQAATFIAVAEVILTGSVKFVLTLDPKEPEFALKLYYLERK